jgi:hypothetical protein
MEILKIEEKLKDGTLKIKDKKPSLANSKKTSTSEQPNRNKKRWVAKSKGKTWFRKKTTKAE